MQQDINQVHLIKNSFSQRRNPMKTRLFLIAAALLTIISLNIEAQSAKRMLWFGNSLTGCGYNTVQPMVNCTSNCGVAEPSGMKLKITPVDVPSCWIDCHENQGAFSKIDSGQYDIVYVQDNTENWIFGSNASSRVPTAATYMEWATHAKNAGGILVFPQMHFSGGVLPSASQQDLSDWWYDSLARATNSIMVPFGKAWHIAMSERP